MKGLLLMLLLVVSISYGQGNVIDYYFSQETLTEKIVNGTLEQDITGWSGINSTTKRYNIDYNNIGRVNCLLDSAGGTSSVFPRISIAISDGKRYYLRLDYYVPSSNTTTNGISIRLTSGTVAQTVAGITNAGQWATISTSFIAAGGNVFFAVYQTANGSTSGITTGDIIYLDNISLIEFNP